MSARTINSGMAGSVRRLKAPAHFATPIIPPGGLVLGIGVYFVVFWVMGRGVDAFLGRKAFDDGIGFEWVFMAFICGMASFILLTIASAVLRQQ